MPTENDYAALVPDLLAKAEDRFGPRDPSYRFVGVAFDREGPTTFFPGGATDVLIRLGDSTKTNYDQGLYQLAHEVVHLLAPIKTPPATMLEEGLATLFSLEAPTFNSPAYRPAAEAWLSTQPAAKNYLDALTIARDVLAGDDGRVRKLREKEPQFFKHTPAMMLELIPTLDVGLAERACARRHMRPHSRIPGSEKA
jgi:hypothetical protein